MQRILDKLTARADAVPDNALLRDTISLLTDIQRHPDQPHSVSWDALRRDFELLQDRGLWERSTENDELLGALRTQLADGPAQELESHQRPSLDEKITIVVPQPISSPLVSNQGRLVLPLELIDTLNHAYFLHILVTDPAQVVPPGKSLLSVMSRPHTNGSTKSALHSKVEGLVHKAFWDEAVRFLSDPEPSAQLSRIRLLYGDLHVALSPLLPPKHPMLVTLSSPLSPTSSPLDSAVMHLREILASLRERCAPVRDPEINSLQQSLHDPPVRSSRPVALATLVAETIRDILHLSRVMKDDLSQTVLGSMTEQQLRFVIAKQAKTNERKIVIDIWRPDRIRQEYTSWLDKPPSGHLSSITAESRFLWIVRIVQELGSPSPVDCPLPLRAVGMSSPASSDHGTDEPAESPRSDTNILPPVFLFSAPALLEIQNYLQALVIAASLGILARAPVLTRSSSSKPDSGPDLFMSRVWTLLRAEIAGEPGASDTKLINLADEVIRARQQTTSTPSTSANALSTEDEATLRAAVDRTLRPEDPVYKLLQLRLLTELSNALVKHRQGEVVHDGGAGAGPVAMRTGRVWERAGKRPRLMLDPEDMDGSQTPRGGFPLTVADIRGFEDPVLSRAVAEVFEQVENCLGWVESVWSDVIETGNIKDTDSSPRKGGV